MREIKFRAFDTKGDGMFYDIQNGITFDDGSKYTFDRFLNPDANDSHEWIVMQFTGLKDKNGKEIYEGDVVVLDTYPEWGFKNAEGVVEYIGSAFYVQHWTLSGRPENKRQVLGNIYEHPHLLKQPSIL
jgi:uncharacterized phage protein (TIGR01671 family)